MSKNKSLLLGFSVGAFIVLLVTSLVASLLIHSNTQNAKADASSIFAVEQLSNPSFSYGEPYPSTIFYATISDADGNLKEVTECNFGTGKTNALVTATLTAGEQYTVNIYGPTFLWIINVNIVIPNESSGSTTINLSNVKTFQFTYKTGLQIQFTDISILDDSWFTDYNDAAVTQTTTVTENA